jgi:hypothetical protein
MTTQAHRARLLAAIACLLACPLAAGQAADTKPSPENVPAKLEFDIPPGIIGPTRDSLKKQLGTKADSTSIAPPPAAVLVPSRSIAPATTSIPAPAPPTSLNAVSAPSTAPAAPAAVATFSAASEPTAAPSSSPAKILVKPAANSSAGTNPLNGLRRLSKDEILTSVTDTFTAYILRGNERALILDFPTTRDQAKMFGRVILFIERSGTSKTRLMTVPEVQKWLTQNSQAFETLTVGNNIRTGEIARFFNTARFQGEPLTFDEQRLYDWLIEIQLLREGEVGVSVVEPEAILISIPQVSNVAGCSGCKVTQLQRDIILQHELSHARYATDTVYQNYVLWFWSQGMGLMAREKFTRFLKDRGYDIGNRELLANEMQAFLMHTPEESIFGASAVGMSEQELSDLRQRFRDGLAPKLRATADKSYQLQ